MDTEDSFERNAMARSAIDLLKTKRQQLFEAQLSIADYASNGNTLEVVGSAFVAHCFDYQITARPRPVALNGVGYLEEYDFLYTSADGTSHSLPVCYLTLDGEMYISSHANPQAVRLGDTQDPQITRDLLELLSNKVLESELFQSAFDRNRLTKSP